MSVSMEFCDIVVYFNILDAMKHPTKDHSIFRVDIHDDVVDEYASDFESLHDKKHSFLSYLYISLACVEFESVIDIDFESEPYLCSEIIFDFKSDALGVVPLDINSLES